MIVKWEEEAVDDGTSWAEEEERLRSQMTTLLQLVMTRESHSAADDSSWVEVAGVCRKAKALKKREQVVDEEEEWVEGQALRETQMVTVVIASACRV